MKCFIDTTRSKVFFFFSVILFIVNFLGLKTSYALYQIQRPYLSVRSVGMGGVRISTGLYDENFFNNPARVMDNPESRFTFFKIIPIEINSTTVKNITNLRKNQDVNTFTSMLGENFHFDTQVILPAFYLVPNDERNWGLAIGLIANAQLNALLRSSYQVSAQGIGSVGPAGTFGYRFFRQNPLCLGITVHYLVQGGLISNGSLSDYLAQKSIKDLYDYGTSQVLDFDFGVTYGLLDYYNYKVLLAVASHNVLASAGKTIMVNNNPLNFTSPRTFGLGLSIIFPVIEFLEHTNVALELTDIGNNPYGSFYKLVHFGFETNYSIVSIRGGFNQGYLSAGLGLRLYVLNLDFATYGEELSLNVGNLEDRRFVLSVAIEI